MDGRRLVLTEEFHHALALLASGENLFLTGRAGTGKSTLIRHFLAQTRRRVVVAAPTGIAALGVGGYTIHRLFSFDARTTLDDVDGGGYSPQRFAKTLAGLDTLIIDEASMVRADLFDMLVIALERFGPEPGQPFGGVQVVLVGDLHQLPPVVTQLEAEYFRTRYASPYFFSADRFRRADFPTVDLTRVFRQAGDERLAAILNGIRDGILDGPATLELNARADPHFLPPADEFWLTLAATNSIVNARNAQRLDLLEGEEFTHFAERVGELELFEAPTDDALRFKVGAQVMMLTNDSAERWVNGTLGRITRFRWTDDGAVVTVDFINGERADVTAFKWEATRPVIDGGRLRHEAIGSYTQLPFRLAWAITIHKAQGQTLDRMVVDLTGGTFASGQLYVALSRCTAIEGLVLTRPVRPKDLKIDRRIVRFLQAVVPDAQPRRYCAIGILTVGEESRLARPRPVELAVVFEDGTSVSTLVNPQRDAGEARRLHSISAADLLLAPTLAQAWAVLAPILAGHTPVGADVDGTLGLVDTELKRLGIVAALPLGVAVDAAGQGSALERARTVLREHGRLLPDSDSASAFPPVDFVEGAGYLLSRDPDASAPACGLPLTEVLAAGRELGGAVLGVEQSDGRVPTLDPSDTWNRVAAQLRRAAAGTTLPGGLLARLHEAESLFGLDLTQGLTQDPEGPDIAVVMVVGARICFTGNATTAAGEPVHRDQINELATTRGLVPVGSVTKSKCDALVTAEHGSQSSKARQAARYGKPVFSAEEFFAWADEDDPRQLEALRIASRISR
ncbi:AAA family ATPase [Tomitella biformata]|uniref:AAA family ATPase n=1 Tax=Tomitella biformata TaxID=630403 RepID=UPI0004663F1B|nr:AAA family ATPase [Tomitella biformata]